MIKGCSLIVHRRVYIKINKLWIRHSNTHSYRHTYNRIYHIHSVQQVHTYALLLKWLCSRTPVCPLLYHVSWMHTQLCLQSNPTAGQDRNTVTLSPLVHDVDMYPKKCVWSGKHSNSITCSHFLLASRWTATTYVLLTIHSLYHA